MNESLKNVVNTSGNRKCRGLSGDPVLFPLSFSCSVMGGAPDVDARVYVHALFRLSTEVVRNLRYRLKLRI